MSDTNSLERMLSVLSVFSEQKYEWTPDELTAHFGYSRPTLYRYLKILTGAGLLTSVPPGRYSLGPRVVELDHLLRMSDPLIHTGSPVVADLAARFAATVLLVRRYGDKMVCIHNEVAAQGPAISYMRGKPLDMCRGSAARAIISALPRRKALPLATRFLNDFRAIGFGDTPEAVLARFRIIKRQGFATSRGELVPDVLGTSAPIFDASRMPIGALCLTRYDTNDDPATGTAIAQAVMQAAEAISRALSADA